MALHAHSPKNKRRAATGIRRTACLALLLALLCILLVTGILYTFKFYLGSQAVAQIIVYRPTEAHQQDRSRKPASEESAAQTSANAPEPAPIIVAADSPFSMDVPTDFDDLSAGIDGEDGLAGFGIGDDGLGDGLGLGDGFGDTTGSGGGKGEGYNDDIQVVLLLDASGSMQSLFEAASASMQQVLTTLSKAQYASGRRVKVNVGIVIYGQSDRDGAPIKLSPFTTHVKKIRARLAKVSCDGANEECGAAIAFAVENFEWNRRERDDMLKVIFIAGNESFEQGETDYRQAIAMAAEEHIIVNTIHCGDPDPEWEEAATLGNGIGLTLDIREDGKRPATDDEIYQTLLALHNCKPLPIGSPAVQRRYINMLNTAAAPPTDPKERQKWLFENKRRILLGYDWDAIEIYRTTPEGEFSIDLLGGEGNLPVSLRGKSEDEIIDFLSHEAERRTQLLELYKEQRASGKLGDKLLQTLQEQAHKKGINIRL